MWKNPKKKKRKLFFGKNCQCDSLILKMVVLLGFLNCCCCCCRLQWAFCRFCQSNLLKVKRKLYIHLDNLLSHIHNNLHTYIYYNTFTLVPKKKWTTTFIHTKLPIRVYKTVNRLTEKQGFKCRF